MGLCKCPKRRVTNMFCFEHRVNVCEHCVATNHTKCIIQSYLQWLQDSDYNPICELCSKVLHTEDCIRLTCYHIYHWSCLDCYARQLPPTTAPAGYRCPSCNCCVFPPSNLVGPVVNVLREKLAGVNWARNGLGLPLLSEDRELKPVSAQTGGNLRENSVVHVAEDASTIFNHRDLSSGDNQGPPSSRRAAYQEVPEQRAIVFDHDDDKYKRRPPGERMRRWWKNALGSQGKLPRTGGSLYKRYCALGLTVFVTIIILLLVMSKLGRYSVDDDPNLELYNNPQVRNN